ncbi:MAG TPA: tRNA (adenosine(37)-N6)-dimethylallyltransferase MiaA [Longimicrobiales bacterium]|nr:tRNA (adenosine(37)-N6)-dimethylallyltransferase MiaA [Longimicrobiales bacterium]
MDDDGRAPSTGTTSSARPVLALAGPTAAGKTALSLALAERVGGEVVSMDSRQVYRGMDIGTAKPTADERARIPHHGLDLIEPGQRYSAGRFARDARGWIREIRGRGRVPLLVGGTGFFLRALTDPLFDEPPMDTGRRAALQAFLETLPAGDPERWLAALDPGSAARLRAGGGAQRVLRALEVALLTGRPLGWWHERRPGSDALDIRVFVLHLPRDVLYERINRRVDSMLAAGLVREVAALRAAGHGPGQPGMTATGYREIAAHLQGEVSLDEAAERIRRATRRYARRQVTWFRHQPPEGTIRLDGTRPADELVEEMIEGWRGGS